MYGEYSGYAIPKGKRGSYCPNCCEFNCMDGTYYLYCSETTKTKSKKPKKKIGSFGDCVSCSAWRSVGNYEAVGLCGIGLDNESCPKKTCGTTRQEQGSVQCHIDSMLRDERFDVIKQMKKSMQTTHGSSIKDVFDCLEASKQFGNAYMPSEDHSMSTMSTMSTIAPNSSFNWNNLLAGHTDQNSVDETRTPLDDDDYVSPIKYINQDKRFSIEVGWLTLACEIAWIKIIFNKNHPYKSDIPLDINKYKQHFDGRYDFIVAHMQSIKDNDNDLYVITIYFDYKESAIEVAKKIADKINWKKTIQFSAI